MVKRGSESKQGNDCTKAFPPDVVPPASLRPHWGLAGGAGRKAQEGHRRVVQDIRVTETAELADRRRGARGHRGGWALPLPSWLPLHLAFSSLLCWYLAGFQPQQPVLPVTACQLPPPPCSCLCLGPE